MVQPVASAVSDKTARPRSTKGVRTRARMIEAAKEIFEENGFLDARITDIAERAGASHGSFYHYFDSKEQIFREVAEAVDDQLGTPMEDVILASDSQLSPQERLRAALLLYFERYRAESKIMGVIEQVSRYDDHINSLLLAHHEKYADQVAGSIRQLQTRGMADRSLDPVLAAAAIWALTGRFAELWLVQGAVEATMDQAVDQISVMLTNILGLGVDRRSG